MRAFVDTNLWTYRLDRRKPNKSAFIRDWLRALFWTDANAPLRADPRFIRFMERHGAFPLWRKLGPPPDCVAEGDGFCCGLIGEETR